MNTIINKEVIFIHPGLIDYKEAWELQKNLHQRITEVKLANRERPASVQVPTENFLIFCQHPHVYTLGKSGSATNLLLDESGLKEKHADFYNIDRGGDITYHGPGQVVGYPILDLENFFTDIHVYLRTLEEMVILTCADYGIRAGRIEGLTGVWIDHEQRLNPRKICAIGVRSSHWITMHGFAFNIETDLSYFNHIIPCGIKDKAVTSLSEELGKKVEIPELEDRLKHHLSGLLDCKFTVGEYEKGHYTVQG
ncbi:MAG TPA: lipoyl(octanoyl) transferase LipB [Cyclobacteriaceae bacterium]|nr:lipoyl(octanoyl) transferase LipB [Cyclobacteriaceae bacterium]